MLMETAIILALVVATYLSALSMALRSMSRLALQRRLEPVDRVVAGQWLVDHLDPVEMFTSLAKICFRVGIFVLVLVEFIGVGESAKLEPLPLFGSFALTVLLLWLFTAVLASALAKYAGTDLIVISLRLLRAFGVLGIPIAWLVGFVDEAVKRLAGVNLDEASEAEAELLLSIEESQLEGGLDEEAAILLENVVEFRNTDVGEVMTPRTDIEGIEETDDLASIRSFIIDAGHSRIPVYRKNLDQIAGILYVKDLVPFLGEDASGFKLEPLLRQPIVVPESKPVRELLNEFQRSEIHLAIVIDEYGGTAGLVTIEDVLEEIVGEIHDEHEPDDEKEPELVSLDDTHAEVDGRFHIDDLNERLRLDLPEDDDYDTVAGFVLAQLGRVPKVGDAFETHDARFTALAATPTHVTRIGLELLSTAARNGRKSNGNGK